MSRVAIYPGSFDPVTRGHEDLIRRSLQFVDRIIVAVAVTVLTYSLWAFDIPQGDATLAWQQLSLVPFGFILLRYAVYVDAGTAGAPEDVVLKDKVIVGLGFAWLLMFVLGVFHV